LRYTSFVIVTIAAPALSTLFACGLLHDVGSIAASVLSQRFTKRIILMG
jgi:hypothetical protein